MLDSRNYAMVEYAIAHGIQEVGFGHGGEHKEARGFRPELTWSAHWMVDAQVGAVLEDFCRRERAMVESALEGD